MPKINFKDEELDVLEHLCVYYINEYQSVRDNQGVNKLLQRIEKIYGKIEESR